MKNAGAVEKESPINNTANFEESTLVSILKVESHESRSQMIPNISSQQFLLDYDENMGVESISPNHDAINDTLDSKPASGVESNSVDIDDTLNDTETNDETSTASDSTKETDSEDEKKADSDNNINIINDESNLVDGTKNEN